MSEPVISAAKVGVRFPGSATWAVRDASLEIGAHDAVGIVGESGSGKTTLARVLVGALRQTTGGATVEGKPWGEVSRRDAQRRHVQMVFQDPIGSLNPGMTALDTVGEVIQVWEGAGRAEARDRAAELLAKVGLDSAVVERRPRSLSGGQCQRVGIARALACRPRVLVADEPTASLDVSVQAQILNLLADLREETEMAIVIVSHDLSVVRHMTDRIVVMYGGEIVERGPTEELFAAPQHAYTKLLVEAGAASRRQAPASSRALS